MYVTCVITKFGMSSLAITYPIFSFIPLLSQCNTIIRSSFIKVSKHNLIFPKKKSPSAEILIKNPMSLVKLPPTDKSIMVALPPRHHAVFYGTVQKSNLMENATLWLLSAECSLPLSRTKARNYFPRGWWGVSPFPVG